MRQRASICAASRWSACARRAAADAHWQAPASSPRQPPARRRAIDLSGYWTPRCTKTRWNAAPAPRSPTTAGFR